jgi:hypothetical protein
VPYAFVQDVPASWEQYERVAARLVEPVPAGLILHLAGPTEEGFRIIDAWESEEAWQDFGEAVRLAPAVDTAAEPPRPAPIFRDFHPAHVVIGEELALDQDTKT